MQSNTSIKDLVVSCCISARKRVTCNFVVVFKKVIYKESFFHSVSPFGLEVRYMLRVDGVIGSHPGLTIS